MSSTIVLFISFLPFVPALVFAIQHYRRSNSEETRKLALAMGGINFVIALLVLTVGLLWLFAPGTVEAAGAAQAAASDPYKSLSAAITEKPEVFGRALIFVGLAEGVAIYGLIIAFIILGR
jgi:V/A-type H+-transporting ATPase subunit K